MPGRPPGSGKTYLGAEVVVELVRLGRKVSLPRTIASSATCSTQWPRAADNKVPVAIGQKTDADGDCASDAAEPYRDYGDLLGALRAGEVDVVAEPAGCGRASSPRRSTPSWSTRRDSCRSPTRAAARNLVLLGDPSSFARTAPGNASARRRSLRPGPRARQGLDDATRPRPLPRADQTAPTRLRRFTSEAFYVVLRQRPARQDLRRPTDGAALCARFRTRATRTRRPRRRRLSPISFAISSVVPARGPTAAAGGGAPDCGGGTHFSSPRTAARSPRSPAPCPPRASARQVPGPGGAGLDLLDGDVDPQAPRGHGIPLQPESPQRGHVAGDVPRRRRGPRALIRVRRPARCSSPTRCAGSSSWRWKGPAINRLPGLRHDVRGHIRRRVGRVCGRPPCRAIGCRTGLGKAGRDVSVVGFGAWAIGGPAMSMTPRAFVPSTLPPTRA